MTTKFIEHNLQEYKIGSRDQLSAAQIEHLVRLFNSPVAPVKNVLGGRATVTRDQVSGLGKVVVKHYRRGGRLSLLISNYYLRLGRSRSQIEFELIEKVRQLGVHCPTPIAWACTPGFLYRAWFVTQEIEGGCSLAQLSQRDEERARACMDNLIGQLDLLIQNGIFHVDLHPGNILVDDRGQVFILDFDKVSYSSKLRELRDSYIQRWRRAVLKHELPEMLSETLCAGLRRKV